MNKEIVKKVEKELEEEFNKIDEIVEYNCNKIINAFWKYNVDDTFFNTSTGYGYGDKGRDMIETILAEILDKEDAICRIQFISGTHALSTALFGILRPGDKMLSVSGTPYDTLHEVVGIRENPSSLKAFGVSYDEIALNEDSSFNIPKIQEYLRNNKVKLIEIQRSRGYSLRKSLSVEEINNVIEKIKEVDKDVVVMVDNCYGELTAKEEPKADLLAGSLIKNLGAGIAPTGAYIAGRKDLVELCADRLSAAGLGKEGGASLGYNKQLLQGIYWAPKVVGDSLKNAVFTSKLLEDLGYTVSPRYNEQRNDIIQAIYFNDEEKLIKFVQGIQMGSAVDSNALPMPWDMPGYDSKIIMASGAFTQGSSIEISCDAPIRPPYVAFMQGGLIYEYSKIAVLKAVENIGE